MKFLTALVLVFSASAFAGHHENKMEKMKNMPFDQHKKMMQEMLEKKSAMVEENRKCVNDAKDNDALMECHKNMKEDMKKQM